MKLRSFILCLAFGLLALELTDSLPIEFEDSVNSRTLVDDSKTAADSADSSNDGM